MEVYCRSNMPVSENITSFCEVESGSGSLECANGDYGDHVNDLGRHFTDLLNIQEKLKCITIPSLDDDINYSAHQEDDSKDSRETIALHEHARKDSHETGLGRLNCNTRLAKYATFPLVKGENTDLAEGFELEPESLNDQTAENSMLSSDVQSSMSPFSLSKSLPTPLKLISAMKGSRERIGAPPRKLSVKWAPDVYDPIPTAVSHVPNNNRSQRHKSDKRNGKNKHKSGSGGGGGKASRGNNKGKDKKQTRKHGGSSNRCFKPLDNLDKLACYGEPQSSAVDFDVDSPDPFCGHSFLKKSVEQLHFPVAEAT